MKVKDVTGRRPDPELILKSLRVLVEIFDKLELKYWMETGNLLGAVREGKLIPWDFDVDVGVRIYENNPDIPDLVKSELEKRGFKTRYLFQERRHFLLSDKDGYAHIDIHFYKIKKGFEIISAFLYYLPNFVRMGLIKVLQETYFSSNKLRPTDGYKRDVKLKRTRFVQSMMPVFFCYKVKKIKFYDFYVNIPVKAEDYLFLNYGKDWRIPKEKFVTYIG